MFNRVPWNTSILTIFLIGCSASEAPAPDQPSSSDVTTVRAALSSSSPAGIPCTARAAAVIANTAAVFSNSGSLVDSYESTDGAYGSEVDSQAVVRAATKIVPNGGVIHGTQTQGSPAGLGVVPVPAGAINLPLGSPTPGSLNINTAAQSITLAPGSYVAANINVNFAGAINVSPPGPVLIWVTGTLNLGGNENLNGMPSNLQFLVQSSGFVNVNSNGQLFGFIYAPTSVVNLNSAVFGGVVGSTVYLNSGAAVHFDQDSTCVAPVLNGDNGLVGAYNYPMYSNCQALPNPSAQITLSSPMTAGPNGFAFQFNANSLATTANPNGSTLSGQPSSLSWQQYIINVRGAAGNTTEVSGFIEPWPSNPSPSGSDFVNDGNFPMVTLTGTPIPTLPAGTQLTITLNTDPTTLAVTGPTFTITLPPGTPTNPTAHPTYYNGTAIALVGLSRSQSLCGQNGGPPDPRFCKNNSAGTVTVADLTPVTSFQLDFSYAFVVSSGTGTITYSASNGTPLVPVPPWTQSTNFPFIPTCSAGAQTAETSNILYSSMPVNGGVQSFGITMNCESGTNLYVLACDGTPFCATAQNALDCVANGACLAYPWTNVPANTIVIGGGCPGVPPFEDRDPLGNWLSQVTYGVPNWTIVPHPFDAIVVGSDVGGTPLMSCRGTYADNSLQVGKTRTDWNSCDIGYGGAQKQMSTYQTLVAAWTDETNGSVPNNALPLGNDGSSTGPQLFPCRAYLGSTGYQLGKVRPGLPGCTIPYGGTELTATNYQVLTTTLPLEIGGPTGGQLPFDALVGGYDTDGAPLYVCVALYAGGFVPGKTRTNWTTCHVGYGGGEFAVAGYGVLVPSLLSSPSNVFQAGTDSDGTTLGVCNAPWNGSTQVGRYLTSAGTCNFEFGQAEQVAHSGFLVLGKP